MLIDSANRAKFSHLGSRLGRLLGFTAFLPALAACAVSSPPATSATAPSVSPAISPAAPPSPAAPSLAAAPTLTGLASWYRTGRGLRRTYSGEALNNHALTAASPMLPMGTLVRIGMLDSGRSVVVRVNDRMPRRTHRLIDVTEIAARELGLIGSGIATVTVTPIVVASAP